MKGKGIRGWIRKVFGDIKVFRHPMFIAYDPGGYRVTGEDTRELLRRLKPGDILLRKFYGYLDGRFIPGRFTHAAVYCGALTEDDRARAGAQGFRTGPQIVIHALAPAVVAEDILTFSRCDELAILRLPHVIAAASPPLAKGVPLKQFTDEEKRVDESLAAGGSVRRDVVVRQVVAVALRSLGQDFDFDFQLGTYKRVYCSELVYLCLKSVQRFLSVRPTMRRVGFVARNAIVPDDFLRCGLDLVWISDSVRRSDAALAVRVDAYEATALAIAAGGRPAGATSQNGARADAARAGATPSRGAAGAVVAAVGGIQEDAIVRIVDTATRTTT